jgi:hypothetical protein
MDLTEYHIWRTGFLSHQAVQQSEHCLRLVLPNSTAFVMLAVCWYSIRPSLLMPLPYKISRIMCLWGFIYLLFIFTVICKGMCFEKNVGIFKVLNLRQIKRLLEVFEPDQLAQGGLPPIVRDAISTTWNNPQANSHPLLFDPSKIIAFSPQFD